MSLVDDLRAVVNEQAEVCVKLQIEQAEEHWKKVLIPKLFDIARHGRRKLYFRWEGFGPQPHYYEYENARGISPFEDRIMSLAKENGLTVSVIQVPSGGRCLSLGF